MKIERSNILELIGSGKNKYHSCVITSYSIDLAFFEQLILPRLRGAGITNINIFVDAGMLEKYLASHLGNSTANFNVKYSITPVHISGAFHPKMLFLAGKNKNYLAVGSGNITSSGLLYNDEIWSSFFMSKERKSAQPIFKSAWQYILTLSSLCIGINQTKINWIAQHSKWIEALTDIHDESVSIKGIDYKLAYTRENSSLYKDVIQQLLPKPKSIKIIAPYYNRTGAFLQKVIDDLDPYEMHCVVDTTNGILPIDFKSDTCQFSDWSDVIKPENTNSIQRLHAKIIQIEYDNYSVLIFGSANATVEAFGISERNFKNEEAIITIQSDNSRDFLKELGIAIPKQGTLDLRKTVNIQKDDVEITLRLLKIKHTELSSQILKITLDEKLIKTTILRTFSSNNELIESIEISSDSTTIQSTLTMVENVFKVAIFDLNTLERISIFGLIQNVELLKKSNPDERLARVQSFESLDIFNSLDFELVLDFLEKEHIFKENNASKKLISGNNNSEKDEGQVISEKEYNRNASQTLEEKVTSENISSLVEEFLDVLKIRENQEEFSSNIEEMALAASDDGLDKNTTLDHPQKIVEVKEGQRIVRKIKKNISAISNLINNRASNNILQDDKTLNALFIGFHILLHFWDKGYTEELSIIKIRYKNLTALSELEHKFGLRRLKTQSGSSKNEVSYHIEYSYLNSLQHFIDSSTNKFTIIGKFSEPITLEHEFIVDKNVFSYNDSSMIFEFINLGVSTILSSVQNNELHLNGIQKLKLFKLTARLIHTIGWNRKILFWRDLILLNTYECLYMPSIIIEEEVQQDFTTNSLFITFIEFKNKLMLDKVNSIPVGRNLVGAIVYSTKFGFGKIRRILKNDIIEFYSPLLFENFKTDNFGTYKEVFIGRKLKLFNK